MAVFAYFPSKLNTYETFFSYGGAITVSYTHLDVYKRQVHKGMVYLYTTHDEDYAPEGMAGFRMKEWLLYTSTDMVNWTDHGTIANLYKDVYKRQDPYCTLS